MRRIAIIVIVAVTLAACGGGGGGGGASTTHGAATRSVPGGSISVSAASAVVAGQPCALRVRVARDAGAAAPTSVEVWTGDGYDPPARPTAATDLGGGDFSATVALPASMTDDTAAWVRVTLADGSVVEAGRGCFAIRALPAR